MRTLLALRLVATAIAAAVASAEAHPHLRFSFRIAPLLEETRLTGLQVQWELDPIAFFDSTWYVALNAAEPVLAGDTPCHALPRLAQWMTAGWGSSR